jgi:hypothetical protein
MLAAAGDLLEPMPGLLANWSYNVELLKGLATRFPAELLEFLTRILSEDAAYWPYRTELLIEALEETTVVADGRLQELRRRWSARTK